MWSCLSQRNVHPLIIRVLQTWYQTQLFVVQWGSALSSWFTVSNGTRQGSILSPYLFNCYIDGLSSTLQSTNIGCFINSICFNHLLYADDAVLLAPSPKSLQILLDECTKFAFDNDLVFSFKKTKVMIVPSVLVRDIETPSFYLAKVKLPIIHEQTYLGVIIRSDGKDKSSMCKTIRSMYAIGNMVSRKFKDCNEEVKVKLFKSYCSTFYCCSLWTSYTTSTIGAVKICHNNVFRLFVKTSLLDSISLHLFKRNVWNFDIIRRNCIYSMHYRVLNSKNSLINGIVKSDYFPFSKLFMEWKSILFNF